MRLANSIRKCFEIFFLGALFLFVFLNITFYFCIYKICHYEKLDILFYIIHYLDFNILFFNENNV